MSDTTPPLRCFCLCHSTAEGNARAIAEELDHTIEWLDAVRYGEKHRARYHAEREALNFAGVLSDDPVAAAVACDGCRPEHCPALRDPAPPPHAARERDTWQDVVQPQSDGGTDDGN